MRNHRLRVELGAAVVAIGAVASAAISGWIVASHGNLVSRETLPATVPVAAVDEVPPVPPLAQRPLPFVLDDAHITNWDRMWGGAFPGAKVVKTVAIHQYVPPPQQPLYWK